MTDLPPAAKFVRHVLHRADGPLTRRDLERECGLPRRTTNDALQRLREAGAVERREPADGKPEYVAP